MKLVTYKCDICGHEASWVNISEAKLIIGKNNHLVHEFHVCSTCYTATPKGVFRKAFNALFRAVRVKK